MINYSRMMCQRLFIHLYPVCMDTNIRVEINQTLLCTKDWSTALVKLAIASYSRILASILSQKTIPQSPMHLTSQRFAYFCKFRQINFLPKLTSCSYSPRLVPVSYRNFQILTPLFSSCHHLPLCSTLSPSGLYSLNLQFSLLSLHVCLTEMVTRGSPLK